MQILFTSVGRRVELIQEFKSAAERLDIDLTIHGTDITDTAPALAFCDKIHIVPKIRDERYIPVLSELCAQEQIDLLIPTIDTDLLLLSENKDKFEKCGTKVMISDCDKVQLCRDKNLTSDFFRSCGLNAPKTVNDYSEYNGNYPCFIKPKDGSSSIDAFKVNNSDELKVYAEHIKDYVIQPFISGEEYTVDIFCNFDGDPVYITPRKRLSVRAGEVLKTEICQDKIIIEETKNLIRRFKPCGPITVQLIRDNTGDDYYIEINPRFGGGAPLSMKAGANSAEAILKILSGERPGYTESAAADGAVYCRFDQSVRVK